MLEKIKETFPSLRFLPNEILAPLTTFRIGGPCTALVDVDEEAAIVELIGYLHEHRLRNLVIGGGSNLLFDSDGFEGVVVRNKLRRTERRDESIDAAGGGDLQDVLSFCLDNGLEGLEFAAGIPGTFGGGLAGNAGAYGSCLGDLLESARIVDAHGRILTWGRDYFDFGYRRSRIQSSNELILSARLRLRASTSPTAARGRCEEILASRASKHPPPGVPSAGSYFKNLDRFDEFGKRVPAGLLLDQVGCKGLRIGGAMVFEKHANIIVNSGDATSSDVLALASEMSRRVQERFGVRLDPEVRYVPCSLSAGDEHPA